VFVMIGRIAMTLTFLALALPAPAAPATWEIDAAHSAIGFGIRHLMVSTVRGNFNTFNGAVTLDGDDAATAKIAVTIDPASIDTREAKRDEHLRSADFFDVARFPTMTFTSKKVEKAGAGFSVTGDLTMHGVTREVVLAVDGPLATVKDPWGGQRAGLRATATLSRKDFGLTWNKALETGGVVVGDEVAVVIDLELIRKAGT
jgi:polyisoprenoid-binding protein YceI